MKKTIDYKWVIFALGVLTVFSALGFCSSTRSLYLKAVTSALSIPRSRYAIGDSLRYITTAVLNIFFGALIKKWGERRMLASGFLSLIAFCLLYYFATNVWFIYAAGICLGAGLAWSTTSVVGYFVRRWFQKNQGTVMGIILASNGIGGALAGQVIMPIIHDESAGGFGYRKAYLLTAAAILTVGIIVVCFFKNAPESESSEVPAKGKRKGQISWTGITLEEAAKTPYFWVTAVCVFLTGACLQSITNVASAHLEDVGLDTAFIAAVFSLFTLMLAATKILTGVCYDHFGLKTTVFICDIAAVIAIFLLSRVNATSYFLAAAYEVIIPFALPLETVVLPLIASDMFGRKDYAKIMGIIVAINTAGYALGSPVMGMVYDLTGTYRGVLAFEAALMAVICVTMQLSMRQAEKARERLRETEESGQI
ncbi:MAG: MFS transporter [Lachnospiraceae bacterium]|nr:MFS transporter [Lachnospiraceae bacterium]